MTTKQGVPLADEQSSLKAGLRGPALLEAVSDALIAKGGVVGLVGPHVGPLASADSASPRVARLARALSCLLAVLATARERRLLRSRTMRRRGTAGLAATRRSRHYGKTMPGTASGLGFKVMTMNIHMGFLQEVPGVQVDRARHRDSAIAPHCELPHLSDHAHLVAEVTL